MVVEGSEKTVEELEDVDEEDDDIDYATAVMEGM